jgi:L-threonylcarbamoyladenylate synthase
VRVRLDDDLERRIARAAELLREGGVVAYPTETFYGLGALASREDALLRLAAAKLRPDGKPLPLVAADEGQVREVAVLEGEVVLRLAARGWPGPLTLVLRAREGLSPLVTAGDATVAIRVPGSEVARRLAAAAGGALVSTSANLSGEPPSVRPDALAPALVRLIDGVLDGGETTGGLPSTIVAFDGGTVRLVRAGAVPWDVVCRLAAPR